LWALFSSVRYHKTGSGNPVAEPFLTLPSKRELPAYYDSISNPMSFNMIRKKLKKNEYADSAALIEDMNIMFDNCKAYNRPESRLYKDACKLQKMAKNKFEDLDTGSEGEDSSSGSSSDEDEDDEDAGNDETDPELKKMRTLYNTLLRFKTPGSAVLIIGMFMEKPSKKDYPDYYEVIANPMDMKIINEKIKSKSYKTVDDFISDARIMFNNCRQYNEEGSEIVKDANTLEKRLYAKTKEMGIVSLPVGMGRTPATKKTSTKLSSKALAEKVKKLIDTVRDYKDPKGRQLSMIFLRLPNIKEFPDYYAVIKKPIDFERIGAKLRSNGYGSLEECQSDLVLMFDNACKYNEPDSQIYKDAMTLQNLVVRTCKTLAEEDQDESSVPNVIDAVQEILNYIFLEMYNQQDTEERCLSDSLGELPEHNEAQDGKKVRALNLDLIKRRLDRGLYKRLDDFQKDIFSVLDRARNLSRTDSQIFEDSVELQTHFIRIRDEACGHGEILQSRALLYTQSDLLKSVEDLKTEKQQSEAPEDTEDENKLKDNQTSSHTFNQQQYFVGEFVLVENKEKNSEPSIYLIEDIFTNKGDNELMIYGNHFFRPIETFHVPTRKFLEGEVFRSNEYKNVTFKEIEGRCYVMSVKDYFSKKPENFEEKNVYVCESRYSSKSRSFKKVKAFWNTPDHIKLVYRETSLEPKRVMSVFKQRIEKHKEELEELAMLETTLEIEIPPNIQWENSESTGVQEGCIYYEQYSIPGPITLRRGDAVYVRAENGKNLIAQIDTMWTAPDGMAYFHGPWFVTPKETPHPPNQMFYSREAFISTIQDTNPLLSVVGRCCILEMEDYVKSRPTQYREDDVHVCENVYDESRRVIRNLPPTGLKRYDYNSTVVVGDEVYYFKKAIKPQKESSPLLPQMSQNVSSSLMEVDNEDSLDAPPSVGSTDSPIPTTPGPATKKVPNNCFVVFLVFRFYSKSFCFNSAGKERRQQKRDSVYLIRL
jgi:protein polybromo-1